MSQNLTDLGLTPAAVDTRHQCTKPIRIGNPRRSAAFRRTAIVDELDVETASGRRFTEHIGLQLARLIPCRLPTHRGVEGKDQPPARPCFGNRTKRFDLIEETINLGAL